jgi:superfamily I DNA/RNA helicase
VKGLDFACVFLVGFDFLEPGPNWPEEQLWSLAYVAITRARRHLVVPWVKVGVVTERMIGCWQDLCPEAQLSIFSS